MEPLSSSSMPKTSSITVVIYSLVCKGKEKENYGAPWYHQDHQVWCPSLTCASGDHLGLLTHIQATTWPIFSKAAAKQFGPRAFSSSSSKAVPTVRINNKKVVVVFCTVWSWVVIHTTIWNWSKLRSVISENLAVTMPRFQVVILCEFFIGKKKGKRSRNVSSHVIHHVSRHMVDMCSRCHSPCHVIKTAVFAYSSSLSFSSCSWSCMIHMILGEITTDLT